MDGKSVVKKPREKAWYDTYEQVKEFYDANGHLSLSSKGPEYTRLYKWLQYQRNRTTSLSSEQEKLLKDIEYDKPDICQISNKMKLETQWEAQYNRLKDIKDQTGSLRLKAENDDLSNWLSRQKMAMRNKQLTPNQEEKLRLMGIDPRSTIVKKTVKLSLEKQWQSQFEKLEDYKQVHGHCDVPRNWTDDKSLGNWVHAQRSRYKKKQADKAEMNQDRINKLENLGFEWVAPLMRKKPLMAEGEKEEAETEGEKEAAETEGEKEAAETEGEKEEAETDEKIEATADQDARTAIQSSCLPTPPSSPRPTKRKRGCPKKSEKDTDRNESQVTVPAFDPQRVFTTDVEPVREVVNGQVKRLKQYHKIGANFVDFLKQSHSESKNESPSGDPPKRRRKKKRKLAYTWV